MQPIIFCFLFPHPLNLLLFNPIQSHPPNQSDLVMARPSGARPLPNPPASNSNSLGWMTANSNGNSSNDSSREAAWYEHEERMRPSYIQQPQRNFTAPVPTSAGGIATNGNLPPLSPSARYQYQQQQQAAYLSFPSNQNNQNQFQDQQRSNQQPQYQQQHQQNSQQMPYRTFSNPQQPTPNQRFYVDGNRPPLSRSSQSRLASNDMGEFNNQNLNNRGKGSAFMVSRG